jgi:hypothetical protein
MRPGPQCHTLAVHQTRSAIHAHIGRVSHTPMPQASCLAPLLCCQSLTGRGGRPLPQHAAGLRRRGGDACGSLRRAAQPFCACLRGGAAADLLAVGPQRHRPHLVLSGTAQGPGRHRPRSRCSVRPGPGLCQPLARGAWTPLWWVSRRLSRSGGDGGILGRVADVHFTIVHALLRSPAEGERSRYPRAHARGTC